MTNTVFANGLEVSCKISGGNSVAAFPDPCWSPPSPPAGPVVIPYANTAYAKDLANGTTSVLIGGKPVARKDQSYLSTSTGNEAATRSFAQGVTTGTIKGKAYYTSWSMNVMVEGLNVPRHTDLMTHNHGSQPGNTGAWAYVSKANKASVCQKDIARVKRKCAVSRKEQHDFKKKQKKHNTRRKKRGKPTRAIRKKTWKDKHCMLLAVKPGIQSLKSGTKDFKEAIENLQAEFTEELAHSGLEILKSSAGNYIVRAGKKWTGGLGCTLLGGFFGTAVCETAVTVWNVLDGITSAIETGYDIWMQRGVIKEVLSKLEQMKEYLKDIKEFSNIVQYGKDSEEYKSAYKDIVKKLEKRTKKMSEAASEDPCINARKCMLVPYTDKGMQSQRSINDKINKKDLGLFGNLFGDQRGCCPGQTGHHLIPKSWATTGCENYNHFKAPVVCAEGTGSRFGSHGMLHDQTDEELMKHLPKGKKTTTVSIDEAINIAADAHKNSVGGHCKKSCIIAQLKRYYKGNKLGDCQCGNIKAKLINKKKIKKVAEIKGTL